MNVMRIAVLTYWSSSDNYGQLLQCYALQKYLKDHGHEVYLVRYLPEYKNLNIKPSLWSRLKGVKLRNLLPWERRRLRNEAAYEEYLRKYNKKNNELRKFNEFRETYLSFSQIVYRSIEDLRENPPLADVYICGSDQVWHDSLFQPNVAGWYLQFGNHEVKRISYAASIGREINSEEEAVFSTYLSKFDAISLREKNACSYVRSIGFNEAVVVADPTILLPLEGFKEIFQPVIRDIKPYIFFYTLNIKTSKEIYWNEFSSIIKDENLDVKTVGSSGYYPARNIIPVCENIQATIPEWISLINDAKYVVTTSFHGVVFCIKLHKPFVAIPLANEYSKGNARLVSLLEYVGLPDRIYSKESSIRDLLHSEISWNSVDSKMNELSQKGIDFLDQVLK